MSTNISSRAFWIPLTSVNLLVSLPFARAVPSATTEIVAKRPIISNTTNNSIKVNPFFNVSDFILSPPFKIYFFTINILYTKFGKKSTSLFTISQILPNLFHYFRWHKVSFDQIILRSQSYASFHIFFLAQVGHQNYRYFLSFRIFLQMLQSGKTVHFR